MGKWGDRMGDMRAPGHGPNCGTRISKEGNAFLLSSVVAEKPHVPLTNISKVSSCITEIEERYSRYCSH